MDTVAYLRELYPRLISGTLSDDELRWLNEYFDTGDPEELHQLIRLYLEEEGGAPAVDASTPEETEALRSIYRHIEKELQLEEQGRAAARVSWIKVSAAAAMVAFALMGGWYFLGERVIDPQVATQAVNDLPPGRNAATLTLASKKKIILSDAADGKVAVEAGVVITKSSDGQLVYEIKDTEGVDGSKMNTLSTAKGETYQVRLPDGTLVALNAASSLTYAASLNVQGERRVVLAGEAYFEVAADATRPFIVETDRQTVEVLGTHFNVQAYSDAPLTRTTLLEGKVRVSGKDGDKSRKDSNILKPGQQAILSASQSGMRVVEVEPEDAVAWKNGYFMFNNEDLESIMTRVSRWYNVEVEYEDSSLRKETFFGSVSRYENISKVLKLLEATGVVAFSVAGNKVTVLRKEIKETVQ